MEEGRALLPHLSLQLLELDSVVVDEELRRKMPYLRCGWEAGGVSLLNVALVLSLTLLH